MPRRMSWYPMREISSTELIASNTFQPLLDPIVTNVFGIVKPARQFFIQNLTDAPVYVSFVAPIGSTDTASITYRNLIIPSNGFFVNDITTNQLKSQLDDGPALAQGTVVTAMYSSAAPTTGSVYFSYWGEVGE